MKKFLINDDNVTVLGNEVSEIQATTINIGTDSEQHVYSISGMVSANKSTVVGTVRVEAGFNRKYINSPTLIPSLNTRQENNDSLKLSISSIERDSNENITAYIYNIVYKNSKKTTKADDLSFNLNQRTVAMPIKYFTIDAINTGDLQINANGDVRNISIEGVPNTQFKLTLNSLFEGHTSTAHNSAVEFPDFVFSKTETSILSDANSNGVTTAGSGDSIKCINGTIGTNGKYSFVQRFPSNIIAHTNVNGEKTGSTSITIRSVEGVEINDKVITKGLAETTPCKVTAINVAAKTITISSAIDVLDKQSISFARERKYNMSVNPISPGYIGASISLSGAMSNNHYDFPVIEYRQFLNPVLTLRASTGGVSLYRITNGTTTAGTGVSFDLPFVGRPNALAKDFIVEGLKQSTQYNNKFELKYVLDRTSTESFTIDSGGVNGLQKFHFSYDNNSSWSNTNPIDNGGTIVEITGLTIVLDSAAKVTLTSQVEIIKWGTKDVTMDLDLSNIVSIS